MIIPHEQIKVIVFDFDGTLVDSNKIKKDAFFELFEEEKGKKSIIEKVLDEYGEESRYLIIKKILETDGDSSKNKTADEKFIRDCAEKYNAMVIEKVKTCNEKPYASELLNLLHKKYNLYLSSTTPENPLKEMVWFRNWNKYFKDIFGYPQKKVDSIKKIMKIEKVNSENILVVGDGISDKECAYRWNCFFYHVKINSDLYNLLNIFK